MEVALVLAPTPTSAAAARALVLGTLPEWGCDELVDDVRVVVTELVSNVVRHAHTDLEVVLVVRKGALRIEVTDAAGGEPAVQDADPRTGVGGRGLRIVEELSDRWGIDRTDRGKTVWAEWLLPR